MPQEDEYDFELPVELPDEGDGITRFVRLAFSREGGTVTKMMVGYELVISDVHGQIKRFDNFHDYVGGFHEHPVGWPQCPSEPKIYHPGVVPNDMVAFGRQEVRLKARHWETEVLREHVLGVEGKHGDRGSDPDR